MTIESIMAACVFTNYCAEKHRALLEGNGKMELRVRFYRCKHCGKVLVIVNDTAVPTICCGDIMDELLPCVTEGMEVQEKHVPIIHQDGRNVCVKVGEVPHPMTKDHWIQWIVLMTDKGIQKKFLCPDDLPQAEFALLDGESIIGAYAYCNKHLLWKNS